MAWRKGMPYLTLPKTETIANSSNEYDTFKPWNLISCDCLRSLIKKMACIWFVFKGQSYSVQALQRTKDALIRGIICGQNALRQFEKASRHFHLLNVTVSYSLSLTYVLAMYLFVYSNSSDHSCCFRIFHIARTFQARCKDIIHRQPAIAKKLEEEKKTSAT